MRCLNNSPVFDGNPKHTNLKIFCTTNVSKSTTLTYFKFVKLRMWFIYNFEQYFISSMNH